MIPRNWNDITVEKFVELQKTFKEKPQTELERHDLLVKRALILTDLEIEEIENLPINELNRVDELIAKPFGKMPTHIRLNKRIYRVIINPTVESSKRFKMVMNACKEGDENLHRIIYSVCVPIKNLWSKKEKEMQAWEVQQCVEDFKQLPAGTALSIWLFFCQLSNELSNVTLQFLEQKMKQMQSKVQDSLKDLAG